jgi:hypothetical protein
VGKRECRVIGLDWIAYSSRNRKLAVACPACDEEFTLALNIVHNCRQKDGKQKDGTQKGVAGWIKSTVKRVTG